MPKLQVNNATIYYETFGKGPLLLFVPGADGRGTVFQPVAKLLSTQYTTVCWDRRGYSRSILDGTQDFEHRLQTDADDANRLSQHLTQDQDQPPSATVFGTSSGARVALQLLVRHPDSVKKVIAHEPPSFSVLPEEFSAKGTGLINHIYDVYRAQGPIAAMEAFTNGLADGDEGAIMRECMNVGKSDEIRANTLFWFEFELRQYSTSEVDLPKIVNFQEKLVPAAGVDSGMGPVVAPIATIAGAVGKDIVRFVGGHLGYMTHPEKWAANFLSFSPKL